MLKTGAAAALGVAAFPYRSSAGASPVASPATTPVPAGTPAETGFAFNTGGHSVTRFDPASMAVIDTLPVDAALRWLSNEQTFWDGEHIWSYDFPDNIVEAVAVSPDTGALARRYSTHGTGPSHSLMLADEARTAWLNIAGDDVIAVLSTEDGTILDEVPTGTFP